MEFWLLSAASLALLAWGYLLMRAACGRVESRWRENGKSGPFG